jgi:ATP-binding cassette subfamily F protein uup
VKTKTVIDAEHVFESFGDRPIIRDFTLRIQRGDRIGWSAPTAPARRRCSSC